MPKVQLSRWDVTAVGQAEEENVYKFICHKQGDKRMDGCQDRHC